MPVLKGLLASLSIAVTTVCVCIILFLWWLQLVFASQAGKGAAQQKLDRIIIWWTRSNRWMIRRLNLITPEIHWQGRERLSPSKWYLVVCNHQTWADILLLQSYLLEDIPPLKFFTKSQLIWLPFIGQAMVVLGFPYVKRVSKAQMKKKPELRYADRDNVYKACERFKNHPTSILNFAEGTRLTELKHAQQGRAFQHLLKPKAGGITYTLEGMGPTLSALVDVTLIYPEGVPTFWDFLQGKCRRVVFDARVVNIPDLPSGEQGQLERKAQTSRWVQALWEEKDAAITRHLKSTVTD